MKTHKANVNAWREQVMKALGLNYIVSDGKIIYKGELRGHKSLVGLLVTEANNLNIPTE